MEFVSCVNAVIGDNHGRTYQLSLCEDKWVGKARTESGSFRWCGGQNFDYQQIDKMESNIHRLILVLESPHKDEFVQNKNVMTVEPAKGVTGRNIRNRLHCATKNFAIENGVGFNLVLVNAVQYQCSLGDDLTERAAKVTRDNIFSKCWSWNDGEGKASFIGRISTIFREGDVVLNCCTESISKKIGCRKEQVQQAIFDATKHVAKKLPHPSYRFFGLDRKPKVPGSI